MAGALLVNRGRRSGKGSKGRSARAKTNKGAARVVPLSQLFAAVGGLKKNRGAARRTNARRTNRGRRSNPLVANRGRSKRNPLVANRGARRNRGMSKHSRQKMSVLAQLRPRNSRGQFLSLRRNRGGKRSYKRNPLVANRGRGYKRNPLVANRGGKGRKGRGRSRSYAMQRYNPAGALGGILSPIANAIGGIPFLGPILSASVMALGGAATGAIAVVPVHYALKYGGKWIPSQGRPFAFTIASVLLVGAVKAFLPNNMPYKGELLAALASVGGAVDAYRALTGHSGDFGGEWGSDADYGDPNEPSYGGDEDMGADDGFGDEENVRPGEWADANLMDAQYSGEDLSGEEIGYAEYGRRAYRKRFLKNKSKDGAEGGDDHQGASEHAGRPGRRHAWLIYWIGFASFKQLAKLDSARRRQVIQQARHAAMARAKQALTSGVTDGDTSMEAMEAAGLLAAA